MVPPTFAHDCTSLVVQIGDVTDRRRVPADDVVHRGDDVVQLPLGDAPVPVDVVQLEDPAETVVHGAPQQRR